MSNRRSIRRRAVKANFVSAWRWPSHLRLPRSSFNGAEDIIYVKCPDGYRCSGWYLSISRLSSIRYWGRDSNVRIKINDQMISGFSIDLNQISRDTGKNDEGVPIYTPTDSENKLIFKCLRPGRNKITFYIEDQPNSSVDARIYRWKWNSKVVVVDMDGTITRSELRGIVCCYTGVHYLHPDVSTFFLYLKALGYKVIYLTARPVSTVNSTRKYLVDDFDLFEQYESKKLPDGPVFTSCDGRIRTIFNFVGVATRLGGTSHYDFKANFLTKMRELFYGTDNLEGPLCAGFGNTEADDLSYRTVGIPNNRIFNISKGGGITHCPQRFSSYGDLLVESRSKGIFPYVGSDDFTFGGSDDFFGYINEEKISCLQWIRNRMPPE